MDPNTFTQDAIKRRLNNTISGAPRRRKRTSTQSLNRGVKWGGRQMPMFRGVKWGG